MTNAISFDDFVESTSLNAFLADSKTARYIYENIICTEEMQDKMIEMSDRGKPAILASGPAVEAYYSLHTEACDLILEEPKVRQAIGRMNAAALKAKGYIPCKENVPLEEGTCGIFKFGTVFHKTAVE